MPKPTADRPNVIADLARRLLDFQEASGGRMPPEFLVTPEEYRELLGVITFRHGPAPVVSPKFMGVPIEIDRGPYPWGSFPA